MFDEILDAGLDGLLVLSSLWSLTCAQQRQECQTGGGGLCLLQIAAKAPTSIGALLLAQPIEPPHDSRFAFQGSTVLNDIGRSADLVAIGKGVQQIDRFYRRIIGNELA